MNPSNESNATLSLARANLPDHDVLFAGARGLGHCLAWLRRPPQRWPVMQWFKELLLSGSKEGNWQNWPC